jgi:hypothetical protein
MGSVDVGIPGVLRVDLAHTVLAHRPMVWNEPTCILCGARQVDED